VKKDKTGETFSISEFAEACGTTKDTLYHYEKRGILMPATDENNHYRYYSINDFHLFQYIAHLRRLGLSIPEIRECVNNRNVGTYLEMMASSQKRCLEEITEAQRRHAIITNAREAAFEFTHIPPDTPKIEYSEEECYYMTELRVKLNTLEGIRKLRDHLIMAEGMPAISSNLIVFKYNPRISSSFSEENRLYMMTQTTNPKGFAEEDLHIKPAGFYLHIFFRMNLPDSTAKDREMYYKKMEAYITDHNYKISTDLYCYNRISRFLTDNPEEYLAEFVIGVE